MKGTHHQILGHGLFGDSFMLTLFKLAFFFAIILSYPLHASKKSNVEATNLNQLRDHILALQENLTSKEAARTEAADTLKESESAISHTNRKLANLMRKKQEANISLNQLNIRSNQIKLNIEEAREQLGKLLYQQYLSGSQDYLQPLLNQQDPNQIARNLYYYKQLTRARSESMNDLRTHLDDLG